MIVKLLSHPCTLAVELEGEEEVAPLTAEKDVIAKNLAELLEILAQEGNWDLGARDDKRSTNIAF